MSDSKKLMELSAINRKQDAEIANRTKKEFGLPEHLTPILAPSALRRENIRTNMIKQLETTFPIQQGDMTLELTNAWVDSSDVTPTAERKAILEQKSLHEKVFGSVVLKDANGKVVDKSDKHLLAKVPYLTDSGAFYVGGTAYGPRNQLRTRAGVFTRKRTNDEIEASFNLSKGANFRLAMVPKTGKLNFELGTTSTPLYPVLRGLGYSHDSIAQKWGSDVAKSNAVYDKDRGKHIDSLYTKLIPAYKRPDGATEETKVDALKTYFDSTRMEGEVNQKTLGTAYDRVTPQGLVDASSKLMRVFKGEESGDDRDALPFQRVHSVEDFFSERVKLDTKDIARNVGTKLRFDRGKEPTIKRLLPSDSFGKGIGKFVTTSSIFTTPTNINPLEGFDVATTITRLGEGAIASERAIPMSVRHLHGSHLGFMGPLRTPEGSKAGIDVRAAFHAAKDAEGRLYTPMYDTTDKKVVYKSADELDGLPIAFPEQDATSGHVDVLHNGKLDRVLPKDVRYQVPHPTSMYSIGANLITGLESVQGNRGLMGSKIAAQALPLKHAEAPLVQVESASPNSYPTYEGQLAQLMESVSPVAGVVRDVDEDYIHIKEDGPKGKTFKVPYHTNLPGAKTRRHQVPNVKKGDRVASDQMLTKSNFTDGHVLTLGTNLRTAYIADHGYNSDDAVTISESGAKKLTSEHMYTKRYLEDEATKLGVRAHAAHAPGVFNKEQYSKVDMGSGIIKKGMQLNYGDPLVVSVRKTTPSAEDRMLGRLHKSLMRTHTDASVTWDKETPGTVVDVSQKGGKIAVTVLTEEKAKLGDKLSGLHGNKGVIGRIIPDDDMIHDESGTPVDLLLTSAGVISRINPGQIIASAIGKAALANGGTPFVMRQFDTHNRNNVTLARDELVKAGLNPNGKETVTDPVTGRKIPGIFVGQNYMLKLSKTTDTNFAARHTGGYDSSEQPTKGGSTAAKSTGGMEANALLAHNARGYLSDIYNIKSQQNGDYWRAVQLGLPAPAPNENFAFSKFKGMLQGAGMNVDQKHESITIAPLTDKDVLDFSSGEIKNAKRLKAKNLQPEVGGLFDEAVTGGVTGKRWGHVDLGEPMVNPVFFEPARRVLGKSQKDMLKMIQDEDGQVIRDQLNAIDVKLSLKEAEDDARATTGIKRDDALKKMKYFGALNKMGIKPGDAYTLKNFPVLPPVMRPILPSGRGDNTMIVDDANFLYRDLILSKEKKEELKELGLDKEYVGPERLQLYNAMSATAGLSEPVSPQSKSRKAKGFLRNIAGTSPKYGMFQSKVLSRKMDLSGSATVALNPNLGVDEIELPEDIAWTSYHPFVVKRLVQSGMKRTEAIESVDNRSSIAKNALLTEIKHRPAVLNRAPSLHRFSLLGVTPKLTKGKTIRVNPYLTDPMNMDFDGDSFKGLIYKGFLKTEKAPNGTSVNIDLTNNQESRILSSNVVKEGNPLTLLEATMPVTGSMLEMDVIDIADFPRIPKSAKTNERGVTFYDVPEGTVVPAVNAEGEWGVYPVLNYSVHPNCKEWKVKTHLDREIIVSESHSVAVLDQQTLQIRKELPAYAVGLAVPCLRGYVSGETVEEEKSAGWCENSLNDLNRGVLDRHKFACDVPADFDTGWLIGAYLGDGWLTKDKGHDGFMHFVTLAYGNGGEDVRDKWAATLERWVPDSVVSDRDFPHEFEGVECVSSKYTVNSKALVAWIRSLNMNHGAHSKKLPDGILTKPVSFRRGVFCGMMDTDGTINIDKNKRANVSYTTVSKELASGLMLLGLSLGLHAGLHVRPNRDKPAYLVTFSTYPILNAQWIKLASKHKQDALNMMRDVRAADGKYEPGRNDIVPLIPALDAEIREMLKDCGGTVRVGKPLVKKVSSLYSVYSRSVKNRLGYATRTWFLGFEKATLSCNRSALMCQWLALCADETIGWDVITSAEPTGEVVEMYDITVPGAWTFTMENGAAVWDTAMFSLPATEAGRKDVVNMKLSNQVFSDKEHGDLMVAPKHEAIFGWTKATEAVSGTKGPTQDFGSLGDAMAAYKRGDLNAHTMVNIKK